MNFSNVLRLQNWQGGNSNLETKKTKEETRENSWSVQKHNLKGDICRGEKEFVGDK